MTFKLAKKNAFILSTFILMLSYNATAAMRVIEVNKPYFYKNLPVIGICELNAESKTLNNRVGRLCTNPTGIPGYYVLMAEKNTLVRVTISSKTSAYPELNFVPSGVISNDLNDKKLFSDGKVEIINSGNSGDIHIYVGGEMVASSRLNGATKYNIDFDIAFEL